MRFKGFLIFFILILVFFFIASIFNGQPSTVNIEHSTSILSYIFPVFFGLLILLFIIALSFQKKVVKTLQILYEERDVERYILQIEKMLKYTFIDAFKFALRINLAIGYVEKQEIDKAIEIMKKINPKKIGNETNRIIYYVNLIRYYYENNDLENAEKTYQKGKKLLDKAIKNVRTTALVTFTMGVRQYYAGNLAESETLLNQSISKVANSQINNMNTNLYLAKIYLSTNRVNEARVLIDYILSQKPMPYLAKRADEVRAQLESQII